MKLKQIIALLKNVKIRKIAISKQRYRIIISSTIGFIFNLLYAIYHCILGITNLSLWFITMCAYYGILATIRFSTILYECKKQNMFSDDVEKIMVRLSGLSLTILSFVLVAINYISLSQNLVSQHNEIVMITIATYTFYKITITVIKFLKQHKNPTLLLKTIHSITYAEVAASILTLQRSMLVSFSTTDNAQIHLMNAITGAFVFLFVLILGISILIKSTRKDEKLWQNQNL